VDINADRNARKVKKLARLQEVVGPRTAGLTEAEGRERPIVCELGMDCLEGKEGGGGVYLQ